MGARPRSATRAACRRRLVSRCRRGRPGSGTRCSWHRATGPPRPNPSRSSRCVAALPSFARLGSGSPASITPSSRPATTLIEPDPSSPPFAASARSTSLAAETGGADRTGAPTTRRRRQAQAPRHRRMGAPPPAHPADPRARPPCRSIPATRSLGRADGAGRRATVEVPIERRPTRPPVSLGFRSSATRPVARPGTGAED